MILQMDQVSNIRSVVDMLLMILMLMARVSYRILKLLLILKLINDHELIHNCSQPSSILQNRI